MKNRRRTWGDPEGTISRTYRLSEDSLRILEFRSFCHLSAGPAWLPATRRQAGHALQKSDIEWKKPRKRDPSTAQGAHGGGIGRIRSG